MLETILSNHTPLVQLKGHLHTLQHRHLGQTGGLLPMLRLLDFGASVQHML